MIINQIMQERQAVCSDLQIHVTSVTVSVILGGFEREGAPGHESRRQEQGDS